MEIINISPNWTQGYVDVELLDTGYGKNEHMVLSPSVTVLSGVSTTAFRVSAVDGEKLEVGWVMDIFDSGMRSQASDLEITSISGAVEFEDSPIEFEDSPVEWEGGAIVTVGSDMGATPEAGWIFQFSDFSNVTSDQQNYWFIKSSGANVITA